MHIAKLCDHAGNCRYFGPFSSELAARDWGMEAQEVGFLPHTTFTVIREVYSDSYCEKQRIEEPFDLGFDPGL